MKYNYNKLHNVIFLLLKPKKPKIHFVQELERLYFKRVGKERRITSRYPSSGTEFCPRPILLPAMGMATIGNIKINILYYFEMYSAGSFQYYEKQTSILDLTKTCPRRFY